MSAKRLDEVAPWMLNEVPKTAFTLPNMDDAADRNSKLYLRNHVRVHVGKESRERRRTRRSRQNRRRDAETSAQGG
jgi:hypothetical protein